MYRIPRGKSFVTYNSKNTRAADCTTQFFNLPLGYIPIIYIHIILPHDNQLDPIHILFFLYSLPHRLHPSITHMYYIYRAPKPIQLRYTLYITSKATTTFVSSHNILLYTDARRDLLQRAAGSSSSRARERKETELWRRRHAARKKRTKSAARKREDAAVSTYALLFARATSRSTFRAAASDRARGR